MTIYICGDSTAASYAEELAPMTGWGQLLSEKLGGVKVENHAMAGRSGKSFLYEGRLIPVEQALEAGDVLLIQFAHNDEADFRWRHTEPWQGYIHALELYIQTARLYGAQPVLLTPICIRTFEDGELKGSHEGYLEAMHALAARTGTPLIDLYSMSLQAVREAGEEGSFDMYMNLEKGVWPGYPDGREDNVHTTHKGASVYAKCVADALRNMKIV